MFCSQKLSFFYKVSYIRLKAFKIASKMWNETDGGDDFGRPATGRLSNFCSSVYSNLRSLIHLYIFNYEYLIGMPLSVSI